MNRTCINLLRNNQLLKNAIISLGLLNIGQAMAQDCEVRLSQAHLDFGQVNYGDVSSAQNPGGDNMHDIGTRFITLNASCPGASALSLQLRAKTLTGQYTYAKAGHLNLELSNASLDGKAVELAAITAPGEPVGESAAKIRVSPGVTVVPVLAGQAAQGESLSLTIQVTPSVPAEELIGRDMKTLEGEWEFEVRGQ